MSLLTRARRRTAVLAAALAVAGIATVATPAQAGIHPGTSPVHCLISPGVCLYETAPLQGFTAYGLTDAGPTNWSYSIFNISTGARLALCGSGTSCSSGPVGYPGLRQCYQYKAFLGTPEGRLPLSTVVKSSPVFTLCR